MNYYARFLVQFWPVRNARAKLHFKSGTQVMCYVLCVSVNAEDEGYPGKAADFPTWHAARKTFLSGLMRELDWILINDMPSTKFHYNG